MKPTPYPNVNAVLEILLQRQQAIFGDKLIGLYLYGSTALGAFTDGISDLDLLAALTSDLTPAEAAAIEQMHARIVTALPEWDNRIEVQYYSKHALASFKTERHPMGNISPGEPFHIIEAGADWLMNWYHVLTSGITLYGVPPATIIAPVTTDEFITSITTMLLEWDKGYLDHIQSRPAQAYVIITLCRGLYTLRHRQHVSKQAAAEWAMSAYPAWAALISHALTWRLDPGAVVDHAATLPETLRFVSFMWDEIHAAL
jgi:hypothetical protein